MKKSVENRVEKERAFWNLSAGKYDGLINKKASKAYEVLFKKLLQDTVETEKLLEIATGTGFTALKLSPHISNITAVDLSPEMIKIAEKHRAEKFIKNVDFKLGDACKLEFRDKAFDTIIAVNVMHLLFEPETALKEMRRALKDDGRIIIPTYCHGVSVKSHIKSRLMSLSGFKVRSRWSAASYKAFVEKNGFKITKENILEGSIPMVYLTAVKR